MYLGVVEAIKARLQGRERMFVPSLPANFDRNTISSGSFDDLLRADANASVAGVSVPIYYTDVTGKEMTNLYPSISFSVLDVIPRFDEGAIFQSDSYQGDWAVEAVEHSKSQVKDVNGDDLGAKPTLIRTRPVQEPYDYLIELDAKTDDDIQMAFLVKHIYQLFRPRDFIRVPMLDGSFRSWDMIYQDFQNLDSRRVARAGSPGTERQYNRKWTYRIEGFLDNTDLTVLQNVVRTRKISVNSMGKK